MIPRPHVSTLFPYTTLFRSRLQTRIARIPGRRRRIRRCPARCGGRRGLCRAPAKALGQRTREDRRGTDASGRTGDRKSTRLNSSHITISYAVFCLKKKKKQL